MWIQSFVVLCRKVGVGGFFAGFSLLGFSTCSSYRKSSLTSSILFFPCLLLVPCKGWFVTLLSVKGEVIVWTFRQDLTLKSMLWLCGYKWIAVAWFTWSWIRINSQQVQYNAKMLSVEKKRFQALCPQHNLFTYISHSVHKCTDSLSHTTGVCRYVMYKLMFRIPIMVVAHTNRYFCLYSKCTQYVHTISMSRICGYCCYGCESHDNYVRNLLVFCEMCLGETLLWRRGAADYLYDRNCKYWPRVALVCRGQHRNR